MAAKPDYSTLTLDEEIRRLAPALRAQETNPQFSPHLSNVSGYMGYRPLSNMMGANLEDADLRWTNFRGINFSMAKMAHAKLWGCCLTGAQFKDADLTGADLTGADLMGANLLGACLTEACLVGARYDNNTQFPKGFGSPDEHGMIFHDEHQGNDSDFTF